MASTSTPRIFAFKATAAILPYRCVKVAADRQYVTQCSNAADFAVGICQTQDVTNPDDFAEIAICGGGAKGIAAGTIVQGAHLMMDGTGQLLTATTGARIVAMAMESAVVGDIFAVEVMSGTK